MTFPAPSLALVTIVGDGASLAATASAFRMTSPTISLALAIVTVLGFGVLLPGEVRVYRQLASGDPDPDVISRIGMRDARLSGLQGLLQLSIVVVMVYRETKASASGLDPEAVHLRWGGF